MDQNFLCHHFLSSRYQSVGKVNHSSNQIKMICSFDKLNSVALIVVRKNLLIVEAYWEYKTIVKLRHMNMFGVFNYGIVKNTGKIVIYQCLISINCRGGPKFTTIASERRSTRVKESENIFSLINKHSLNLWWESQNP